MTERLYYTDAELLSFDATATAYDGGPTRVILDRTAFYPTSGGQPHDTGVIAGIAVMDVIDDGDRVIHVTERAVPLGAVSGIVDRPRRRDHMQQHTAQHLLSALAADTFGWHTASVHFGAAHSTIEFDTASVAPAQLVELEHQANQAVADSVPIRVTFEDAGSVTGLRKPSSRTGRLRVVTMAGIDRSACGGTHVATTAQIGAVMLLATEQLRGHVRVAFVAGDRLITRAHTHDAMLQAMAAQTSCSVPELPELVGRRHRELALASGQVERLEREVARLSVSSIVSATVAGADGVRRVRYPGDDGTFAILRAMAQEASTSQQVLFVATAASPPSILIGASAELAIDAGAWLKAALGDIGGRGGGSPRVAQGTALDIQSLRTVADRLMEWGM